MERLRGRKKEERTPGLTVINSKDNSHVSLTVVLLPRNADFATKLCQS